MRKFDFFEFAGILCPGVIFIFGVIIIFTKAELITNSNLMNIGNFGVFLVFSYVIGHLMQLGGNVVEIVWWRIWNGNPTDWVRSGKRKLLSEQQLSLLTIKIKYILKLKIPSSLCNISTTDWYSIVRQIYVHIRSSGYVDRIDIFNANYNLFRGVSSSFVSLSIIALVFVDNHRIIIFFILIITAILSLLRMHIFGIHYGRELFIQFISIDAPSPTRRKKK